MAPMEVIFLFFSEDVAFAHHFVAILLPSPSHSIGVLVVLAKLSKIAGNPAKRPVYSGYNELL